MTRWCVFELWLVHGVRQCTDISFLFHKLLILHYFTLFLAMFLFLYPTCPAHLQFQPHTLPSLSSHSSISLISFINEWIKSMPLPLLSLHQKYYYTLYFTLLYHVSNIFKNICWIGFTVMNIKLLYSVWWKKILFDFDIKISFLLKKKKVMWLFDDILSLF